MRQVRIKYIDNIHVINVNMFPSECGLCHKSVEPTFISGAFVKGDNNVGDLEVAFQCTNSFCNSLIIGYYERNKSTGYFDLIRNAPISPEGKEFDPEIKGISPNFVEIYNQSFHAEQNGLSLISGIGYRKALEFLIKDFLIYLNNDQEESILNMQLGQCLNTLDNRRIKEIAKRATWIGNDEAHYKRKWENKDVNDLKKLIEITVHYIAMEVSADSYLEEMS